MTDTFHCPRGPGPGSPFHAPFNGEASWRDDRTCSYCGSIDPDLFFEQIAKGAKITPTDKNYKVYVDLIDHRVGGAGKFYFQHLSAEQQSQFIDAVNNRELTLAYPGYFYVTPFFAARKPTVG